MIERIGFIGTGTITEAIVTGLAAAPRGLREIWVSPRNQETAARLSGRHALVRVGRDNQDVADRCDLLCLAVRPQIAEQVLSQLHLAPTHHILSFIATWNRERIAALMPEVKHIVRLAPLPMVAQAMGPTIIYPEDRVATELFAPLGAAIPVENEDAFDCLFASTSLMGSFFAMIEAQATWLHQQGIPYPNARTYLASLFNGLACTANTRRESFAELSKEFSTPGGLNEQMTADLESQGVFRAQASALDRILARIRKQ
ncbi:pyrroline-5-carboxylate reductase [Paraburkholderia fungorum]|uniref:pyrroline-5-carboxylate reductase n=1 Tax=Paraburkholderia fungorum TaxID=134537 RepID=UPI0038BDA1D0